MGSKENRNYVTLAKFFSLSYRVAMTSFTEKRNTKEGCVEGDDEFIVSYIDSEVSMRHFK